MEVRGYAVTGIAKERFDPQPAGDSTPYSAQLQVFELFGQDDRARVADFPAGADGLVRHLQDDVMLLEVGLVSRSQALSSLAWKAQIPGEGVSAGRLRA